VNQIHLRTTFSPLLILGEVAASIASGGGGYSEKSLMNLSPTLSLDKERGPELDKER
jgi:hypothetical protein